MSTTGAIIQNTPTAKSMIDMLLAQHMLNIVSNISTSNSSSFISLTQFGGLLALLCLEEFRTIISDAISYFRTFIKSSTLIITIKNSIIFVIGQIKNIIVWKHKENDPINIPELNELISYKCVFEIDHNLFTAVLNYMLTKKSLKYNIDHTDIKYDTSGIKNGLKYEKWNRIQFENDSIEYLFNSIVHVTRNSITNTIIQNRNEKLPLETDEYRLISKEGFCDLFHRLMIFQPNNKSESFYVRLYLVTTKLDKEISNNAYDIKLITQFKNELLTNKYVSYKTSSFNMVSRSLAYFAYICKLYENTTGKQVTTDIFNILTGSNSHVLLNYKFTHDMNDIFDGFRGGHLNKYKFIIQMAELGYYVEWKKHYIWNETTYVDLDYTKTEEFIPTYIFNNKHINLGFTAISNTKTNDEISSSFDKLLKVVCSDATKFEKDKYVPQKTYFLSISRKTKIEQLPNPAFESWLEMKNTLLSNPSVELETRVVERPLQPQLLPLPPPKTLSKETEIVEVLCKELGTCFKPLDTLYITEQDMIALTSSIEIFRDQKNMLKELGLPNKYGLFLSGPPGTGKTSTIYAVATYLQKPLYYVGLNDVHTNHELSMLIEHIYEKSVAGGIIVFEDIDAMTNIVLSRETTDVSGSSISSVVDIMKDADKELTLSYFLNLLDGIMSRDGMITIASSNHPEKIDAAFLRDGRFDIHIHLGYANKFQISKIFKMFFKRDVDDAILKCVPEGRYTPANFIFRFKIFVLRPETTDAIIMEPFLE